MVRTYITAISLQGRGDLEKGVYTPADFVLHHNRETSFPIIPVIAEHSLEDGNAKIIALRAENTDTRDNFEAFVEQLAEIGIHRDQIVEILISEEEDQASGLKTVLRIMDAIPDDSMVYADITFGTKPMAMYILYTTIFIEKMKNVEVEGIYYGWIPRNDKVSDWSKAKLFDMAILKDLGDAIEQLSNLEITDVRGALQQLIDM